MRQMLVVIIIMLYSYISLAAATGKTSAAFLKIGAGSRAEALGGAYTSLADDIFSVHYNPAGLSYIHNKEIAVHYSAWLEDIAHNFIGAAFRISDKSVAACDIIYLSMGNIDKTNEDFFGRYDAGSYGTYTADDISLGLSYGYKFDEDINLGIKLKYIKQSIAGYSGTAYALDIGVLSYYLNKDVKIGFSVLNIGSGIKFVNEKEPLPLAIRAGTSMTFGEWIFSADLVKYKDNDLSLRSGLEYKYRGKYFVRAGYRTEDDLSKGISAGIGLNLINNPNSNKLSLDYAFIPKENFGDINILSMTYEF